MSKPMPVRSERIELRAKPEIKTLIERAAQLRHTTISAYLLESGLQKAQADLRDMETLVLNMDDRDLFFTLLNSPPEPNAALRSLFQTGSK